MKLYPLFLATLATLFSYNAHSNDIAAYFSVDTNYVNETESIDMLEGESLNLYNSSLKWRVVETVLPGPAGMDLVLSRSYNHRGQRKWKFDIPEMDVPAETKHIDQRYSWMPTEGVKVSDYKYRVLHIPGLEPIKIYGSYSLDRKWYVSADNYSKSTDGLTMTLTHTVFGPNGQKVSLSQAYAQEHGRVVSTSKSATVLDSSGNTISYSGNQSGIDISSSDGRSARVDFKIVDDGAEGRHNYIPPERSVLERLTVHDASSGNKVWLYTTQSHVSYPFWCSGGRDEKENCNEAFGNHGRVKNNPGNVAGSYRLVQSTRPDGLTWNYQYESEVHSSINYEVYSDIKLLSAETPRGAKVSYQYQSTAVAIGDPRKTVARREVSGVDIPTSVFTYQYNTSASARSTVVTSPSNIYVAEFGWGYNGGSNQYTAGRIVKEKIFNLGANISTAQPLRTIEYEYQYDGYGDNGTGDYWSPRYSADITLKRKSIDGYYITLYSGWNSTYNQWSTKTDSAGNLSRTTQYTYQNQEPSGSNHRFVGLVTSEVLSSGSSSWSTSQSFNTKGQITSRIENGIARSYSYNSQGDLAAENYSNHGGSRQITYSNYYRGTPRLVNYPGSEAYTASVDWSGNVLWTQDPEGNRITYTYDALNRVRTEHKEGINKTNFVYGQRSIDIYQNGTGSSSYNKRIKLDSLGREIATVETGSGISTVYTNTSYDASGRTVFASYPSHSASESDGFSSQYDGLNRLISTTQIPTNHSTSYQYIPILSSSYARKVVETDARGYQSQFFHKGFSPDSEDWLAFEDRPEGQDTYINRNGLGLITSVTRGGLARTYNYQTGTDRLSSVIEPERNTVSYTYDASGNTRTKTVAGEATVTYSYDGRNRLTNESYNDGLTSSKSFTYFKNGLLKTASHNGVNQSYAYTTFGAPSSETLSVDGTSFSLNYSYNSDGVLSSLTYPNGLLVSYALDGFNRAKTIWTNDSVASSPVSNITYHPTSTLSSFAFANGVTTTNGINSRRMVNSIIANGTMNYSYSYDSVNNVVGIYDNLDANQSTTMTYDGLNRLVSANSARWGYGTYNYDVLGNITAKSNSWSGTSNYTYDANNRLSAVTGGISRTFNYDGYGNATSNGVFDLDYNAAGRMITVDNGSIQEDYLFAADDLRVKTSKASGDKYSFYTQSGDLVFEYDVSDNKESNYIYLGNKTVARLEVDSIGSDIVYYHNDALGSPRVATTASGSVKWKENYLPFGEKLDNEMAEADNVVGFTGKPHDRTTGFTYLNARFYDPAIGRFMATDPVQYVSMGNQYFQRYSYADNNPYMYSDPSGERLLKAIAVFAAAVKAFVEEMLDKAEEVQEDVEEKRSAVESANDPESMAEAREELGKSMAYGAQDLAETFAEEAAVARTKILGPENVKRVTSANDKINDVANDLDSDEGIDRQKEQDKEREFK